METNTEENISWKHQVNNLEPKERNTLDQAVKELLEAGDLNAHLALLPKLEERIIQSTEDVLTGAFNPEELLQLQKSLYYLYEEVFRKPTLLDSVCNQFHPLLLTIRNKIEQAWEDEMRANITLATESIPETEKNLKNFVIDRWENHRASKHPLFDYLEREASHAALANFFLLEGAVSTRFADIIVLSLIGAGEQISGYLAENLWEEMGYGDSSKRHTKLFERLLKAIDLGIPPPEQISEYCLSQLGWRGIAGYNLYIYFALHRRHYYRNIGGIGIGEWIVPEQCQKIINGCFRVGFSNKQELAFYVDHIEADTRHGETWVNDIIVPMAIQNRDCGYQILEGAEMRLNAAADYYDEVLEKIEKTASPYQARSI